MSIKRKIKSAVRPILIKTRYVQKYQAKQFYKRKLGCNNTDFRICFSDKNKVKQISQLLTMIEITIRSETRFQHWIDERVFFVNQYEINDALPPNYNNIICHSIIDLIKMNEQKKSPIAQQNIDLLTVILNYLDRIISEIDKKIEENSQAKDNLLKSRTYFERMKLYPADTLEEGMQRVLFWSSLFWQTRHTLVGLGRLDKVFEKLKLPDKEVETKHLIIDFYDALHNYYTYKSNAILGDTGQIIILGGTEENGQYFYNHLTYSFIKAMVEFKKPDPKLLLRVSSETPEDLLEIATTCIATGIGCPLLANDEVIIPSLEDFGYSHKDACNYVTSACWETLSYGKSWGRGNLADINFAKVLVNTYKSSEFTTCKSFDELIDLYIKYLVEEVRECLKRITAIKWENNPLMTLFTEGCMESEKGMEEGGAVYHDYGILSVGMANAIDSLFNIKNLAFSENNSFTLKELKEAGLKDYEGNDYLKKQLSLNEYYGHDDDEVIKVVSTLIDVIDKICNTYRNPYGGKVKFGLSSPNYVSQGQLCGATLDGRNANQPLSVHISGKNGISYTELINFAGALDYSGYKVNAGVVDYFVSPELIRNNFKKFVMFLKMSIETGFFEMQLNVVSSKTLIEAKEKPELFPDLIVRVWGFSAYFKDIPEEYQDVLIQRAIYNEKSA